MVLPPFHLERYFARYEFTARHLLSSSDCETWTVAELLALEPGGQGRLERLRLGYTESAGDPELRQAIAGIYRAVEPGDVLVHAGAEEAIFTFMHVALEPGDHLVVHAPAYQSLYSVAEARGVEVGRWQASEDDGWSLDPEALAALVRKDTKAVVLNCPHNPTGYLMDRERFDAVVEIARRHGLLLFSDEVYRELEHDPAARLPAACDVYERAVSLGVMSKTYGLAGLRIGWVATRDAGLLRKMAGFKDYLTICNPAPSELLAKIALAHRQELAERNRRIVLDNLAAADRFFARHRDVFGWRRPQAGPVAFVRLGGAEGRGASCGGSQNSLRSDSCEPSSVAPRPSNGMGSAQDFCDRAVREASVLLLPSTVFEAGDEHVRFGFGRKDFAEGLAALSGWLGET